jgi:hypothetical protein
VSVNVDSCFTLSLDGLGRYLVKFCTVFEDFTDMDFSLLIGMGRIWLDSSVYETSVRFQLLIDY